MASTIKDVAKRAGVSTATVSRVINGDPRISSKTKEKVLCCIRELDYKINNIARSLKTNKTHTIGFMCPELANTFFMTVAKGVYWKNVLMELLLFLQVTQVAILKDLWIKVFL